MTYELQISSSRCVDPVGDSERGAMPRAARRVAGVRVDVLHDSRRAGELRLLDPLRRARPREGTAEAALQKASPVGEGAPMQPRRSPGGRHADERGDVHPDHLDGAERPGPHRRHTGGVHEDAGGDQAGAATLDVVAGEEEVGHQDLFCGAHCFRRVQSRSTRDADTRGTRRELQLQPSSGADGKAG